MSRITMVIVAGVGLLAWTGMEVGVEAFSSISSDSIHPIIKIAWSVGAALVALGLCWRFRA